MSVCVCLKRELERREKEKIEKRFGKPHVRHAQGSNLISTCTCMCVQFDEVYGSL